jgi:hypothetical protein
MKYCFNRITLSFAILFCAMAQAHHSFLSQYDPDTSRTLEGVVTEVWYRNPHSRVYVEVTGDDGEAVLWETETYPRNILSRRGWKHDALNVGDTVVVTGRLARNGANRLQIITIVRPSDGWEGVGYSLDSTD